MSEEPIPDSISYNFHVRPILSDKCFACHGPDANKRDADLRLDIPEEAYKALKSNAAAHGIVPFEPKNSEVFLRISSKDTSYIMPPIATNLTLTATEIAIIEKWIKQGAKYEKHWAFTAPKKPAVPKVKNTTWVKNEIDYFVLDKLEHKKIAPNPEADKERLLRRVSLDITGLPPSLQMMDKFMADNSPNAYEKVIETLLASPAYGERMALHWMDVSRYADSHGYQDDNYRSQWPWRDWVIHAFNNNTPYNKFISWQLAGDLMPQSSKEQLLATAFNRNHKITEEGGVIDEEYRVEYVKDRTNTLGKAILGITLECAQCHDHKYDPFSQKEYFQMTAFFNNVKEVGLESTVGGPETFAKKPFMEISNADVQDILKFVNKQDTNKLIVSVMGDQDTLRKTYVLNRGVYDAHGEVVQASTPKSVLGFSEKYPKNRLGLTQWLFDKQNPLTSRVFVNQVWQEYFGRGLVKTSGDFGMQGELPSHPELLDWLAVDFMNNGWNIKRLVKQIVLSATYRQSAVIDPDKFSIDPDNIFLARAPRYRIPAEHVRDVVLSSSGLLVPTIGGPSVKPYQPAGLWEAATSGRGLLASYRQDHQASLYRRGLYTFIKRTVPPPVMAIFDASNRDQCEVKRLNTNTPLQALAMLNDPTVLEASRVLAARLLQDKGTPETKIITAFRRIVCRKPKEQEIKRLTTYYADQLNAFKQKANADKVLAVGEFPIDQKVNKTQLAALMGVITIIYNLEETITKS
ncbi:PSD1 and planctomycete cytochrome C domain-containing protein [Sphingobacterium anhuiense]